MLFPEPTTSGTTTKPKGEPKTPSFCHTCPHNLCKGTYTIRRWESTKARVKKKSKPSRTCDAEFNDSSVRPHVEHFDTAGLDGFQSLRTYLQEPRARTTEPGATTTRVTPELTRGLLQSTTPRPERSNNRGAAKARSQPM